MQTLISAQWIIITVLKRRHSTIVVQIAQRIPNVPRPYIELISANAISSVRSMLPQSHQEIQSS